VSVVHLQTDSYALCACIHVESDQSSEQQRPASGEWKWLSGIAPPSWLAAGRILKTMEMAVLSTKEQLVGDHAIPTQGLRPQNHNDVIHAMISYTPKKAHK
jgi:hypothetical protein